MKPGTGRIYISRLPSPYRRPVQAMCRRILRQYPNTAAFVVIGSVADGSWAPDSDADLVWVISGRRRKKWHDELDYDYEGVVELVTMNLTSLKEEFAQHSPMSRSIQRGIVLYDPRGIMARLRQVRLGPPTREWMDKWWSFFSHRLDWGMDSYRQARRMHRRFCRDRCTCQITEVLTRAVVNLARVLLATEGVVAISKAGMRPVSPAVLRGPRLREAMEIALKAHHEKRDLALPEAAELAYLGRWLRKRLAGILGQPA
ncbi:MAG: nucleotidyltransferase domain-containing protein [Planctomycetota bacterium]